MAVRTRSLRRRGGSLAILDALLFLLVLTTTLVLIEGVRDQAASIPSADLERVQAVARILPQLSLPAELTATIGLVPPMALGGAVGISYLGWQADGVPELLTSWVAEQVRALLGTGWGFAYLFHPSEEAVAVSPFLLAEGGEASGAQDRYAADEMLDLGVGSLRLTAWRERGL